METLHAEQKARDKDTRWNSIFISQKFKASLCAYMHVFNTGHISIYSAYMNVYMSEPISVHCTHLDIGCIGIGGNKLKS